MAASVAGFLLSIVLIYVRIVKDITVDGWTSVTVMVLTLSGAILFALGIIAEYIGVAVRMAMGRPPYLIVSDSRDGPLAHTQSIATSRSPSSSPSRLMSNPPAADATLADR